MNVFALGLGAGLLLLLGAFFPLLPAAFDFPLFCFMAFIASIRPPGSSIVWVVGVFLCWVLGSVSGCCWFVVAVFVFVL